MDGFKRHRAQIQRALLAAAVAGAAIFGVVGGQDRGGARASSAVSVSYSVSRLPHRPDIVYESLSPSVKVIAPSVAVQAAEVGFGIPSSAIDTSIPVTPAIVTLVGSRNHQHEAAWVITANYNVRGPANGVLYRKVCIVVNASTGRYEYAYAVDPDPGV